MFLQNNEVYGFKKYNPHIILLATSYSWWWEIDTFPFYCLLFSFTSDLFVTLPITSKTCRMTSIVCNVRCLHLISYKIHFCCCRCGSLLTTDNDVKQLEDPDLNLLKTILNTFHSSSWSHLPCHPFTLLRLRQSQSRK